MIPKHHWTVFTHPHETVRISPPLKYLPNASMMKNVQLKHPIPLRQRMFWSKNNKNVKWTGTPDSDNVKIFAKATLGSRKIRTGLTLNADAPDLSKLWSAAYNGNPEKWGIIHPFSATTNPVHLADNIINFLCNGVQSKSSNLPKPRAIALIVAFQDANVIHASWLCEVCVVLINVNDFSFEAFTFLIDDIRQLY